MKLELSVSKPVIAEQAGEVYLRAVALPPDSHPQVDRRVRLVEVVDNSGSMSGSTRDGRCKIDHARAAVAGLVGSLRADDHFGLVTFSSDVRVLAPLAPLTADHRARVFAFLDGIEPEESTALHAGLVTGGSLFSAERNHDAHDRLVLVTDGVANVGVSDPEGIGRAALLITRRGVTVSTVGLGLEFNAEVLGRAAQSGGGSYRHVHDAADMETELAEELREARSVQVEGAEFVLDLPDGVALDENLNGYPQAQRGNAVRANLGVLSAAREVVWRITGGPSSQLLPDEIVVGVQLKGRMADSGTQTVEGEARLRVVSRDEAEETPSDEEVMRAVGQLIATRAIREASHLMEQGDVDASSQILQQAAVTASALGRVDSADYLAGVSASYAAGADAAEVKQTYRQAWMRGTGRETPAGAHPPR